MKDLVPGSHLVLAANDQYALGRPKLDEVEVRFITDPNTMVANILAGVVQLTMGRGLDLEQANAIHEQRQEMQVALFIAGCLCAFPQYLNPSPTVLLELPFRRALSYATQRQDYADSLESGLVPEAQMFLAPNQPEFQDVQGSIVRYPYDPREAAELIEGLGYTKGGDGFYRDSVGQRLSLEMRTTPGEEIGKKVLFAVADSWQRVGIEVDPIVIPPQQATDREWRANFPAFDMVNQPSTMALLQRFLGKESSLPENEYRGNNRMRYRSPELDSFIDKYFNTIPWTDRMQAGGQALHHITDNVVNISLLYNATPVIASSRLNGVGATNVGWNSQDWSLK